MMRAMRVPGVVWMTVLAAPWAASCGGDGGTGPPPNPAPIAVGSLSALTMVVGDQATTNLASIFYDPDGDALTYAAATSDEAVATASVSGSTLTVTGTGGGAATITVTATDPGGLSATHTLVVTVPVGLIVGTVSIEGTGVDGVFVGLSNGDTATTVGGDYRFDNVRTGTYTVTISGYPSDGLFDAASTEATISSPGQTVTVDFSGSYIRTANLIGRVTVENMGLGGVTVALSGVSTATATTDDNGQYAFTGLRMGRYLVEISGYDTTRFHYSNTAVSVTMLVGEVKSVSFDGTHLRTAGVMGQVSVKGEGVQGVIVRMSGGPDGADQTTTTGPGGQYSFARLRAGTYQVGISGYDTDDYEFEVTFRRVTVVPGETAYVSFEGVLLRTAVISGRVRVEGVAFQGIPVTLSMADAQNRTAVTDFDGVYSFTSLAAGDYTVSIMVESNAYVFDETSKSVTVAVDQTAVVNFEGTHASTADGDHLAREPRRQLYSPAWRPLSAERPFIASAR